MSKLVVLLLGIVGTLVWASDPPVCDIFNAHYTNCMNLYKEDCDCFDWDRDRDVDMRDFAVTQNNFWRVP